jgi:selenocysteine lyase/cysteine desulfurase
MRRTASVNWILEIGPDVIERRVLDLAASARSRLRGLGAVVEDSDSQIVIAGLPGKDASRIATELRSQNVVVAARHGRLRISPHFYNNEDDLQRFEDSLRELY